jgi:hypothetical protein
MKHTSLSVCVALLAATALLLVAGGSALAHGQTQVGDYELEIGFHNEPAYQGEPNGLDLFVTNTQTGEKVNGLEETLQAEIIYGSSKKEVTIEPQDELDGAYTAFVLPTATGDYTWHIWGTIEDTPVDVSMTSSPDTFGSVEPKAALAFPAAEPSAAELQAQATAAAQMARMALVAGLVGVVLGAGGLIVGFLGLRTARTGNVSQPDKSSVALRQS